MVFAFFLSDCIEVIEGVAVQRTAAAIMSTRAHYRVIFVCAFNNNFFLFPDIKTGSYLQQYLYIISGY